MSTQPDDRLVLPNASVAACDAIRAMILNGRLTPGQRLKETDLARDLGISRTPIREALRLLEAEGMVELTPKRGAAVSHHTRDELDDLYQLRAVLEGHAVRRAAQRVSEADIASLSRSCDRFEAADLDDIRGVAAANQEFHSAIVALGGSPRLSRMARSVTDLPLMYDSYASYTPEEHRLAVDDHRRIVQALARGDGERAQVIIRDHVLKARDTLLASVNGGQD